MASNSQLIPWREIKALSFDIYGTLIDWEGGIVNTLHATELGPFLPASRTEILTNMERYEREIQHDNPSLKQRDGIAEGLRRFAAQLRVVEDGHLTQAQVDEAAKQYGSGIGAYPAFADTVAAIQRLGERFKLIPLTNVDNASFSQTLDGPLKGCHFDAWYTAQDIGSYKPDLKNFRYLLEHLKQDFGGIEKEQLVHVAQSLYHDHKPAREVGIPYSIWVDRKGVMGNLEGKEVTEKEFGFKFSVESLKELADLIDEALA
ncbi:HAD-like protein [Polychaeton citri CBS 116435]|uniref:HAD-like protein n=1 Tax=Polychaeton citri CBS 116435 TaxID=1314669 RepID=A0A9P4QCY9_9PEZI|nr:HAD-like protein [Polychaeton citri CBS 116435]